MRPSLILLLAAVLPASDWYVTTTGSDSAAGTSSGQAFASLARAAEAVRPGDTIWVAAGTYHATRVASFWEKAGTAALPILVAGIPGQARPVIDCSAYAGASTNLGIYLGGSAVATSHVTIRRLALRNPGGHCLAAQNVDDLTVEDCELGPTPWNGIWVQNSARTVLRGNWLHDGCGFNYPERSDGLWGQGIGLPGCTDALVEGNLIERTRGEGIDAYGGALRSRIVANSVLDAFSCSIYLDRARASVVERNFIRATDSAYFRTGKPASALVLADETKADDPALANLGNVFRNNVAIGCRSGFSYGAYTGDGSVAIGLRGCVVANNTLTGAVDNAISVDSAPGHTGDRFAGNLLRQPSGYTFSFVQAQNDYAPVAGVLEFDRNAWWDSTVVVHGALGSPRVTADPLVVLAAGTTPWSQAPATGSPLTGVGPALAEVTDDFQGRPRPIGTGSEIGAFELTGSGVNEVSLALPAGATLAERVFTTWNWGDGTAAYTTVGLASGHRYAAAGTYTLSTTIRDPEHATTTSATQSVVAASSPVLVTVSSASATASEAGAVPATFTVTRSGTTGSPLTVAYAVAGSATAGADYVALSGSLAIPAGAASVTVAVTPVDDGVVEGDETVSVVVAGGVGYAVGSPASVSLVIADRPAAGGSGGSDSGGGGGGGCGAGAAGLLAFGLLGLRRRSRVR